MTSPYKPAPMQPASPSQRAFTAALLDPSIPTPAGLFAWNGSDPAVRFAVYRNNVVHSLVAVLGDTFPVVRALVGEEFFSAMARLFVAAHPPQSPLMHRYGAGLPDWMADFEPATALPSLPDVARLEWARLVAFHAADANAVEPATLMAVLQAPERLVVSSLLLHASFAVVRSAHPVVSLWSAHQLDDDARDEQLARVPLHHGESALVFRRQDDALVLEVSDADAALAFALAQGLPLGEAQGAYPEADLIRLLTLMLRHELVIGLESRSTDNPVANAATQPRPHSHPQPAQEISQ